MNIFGLATPQIQASLHIPENQVALTVAYFRAAALSGAADRRLRRSGGTAAAVAVHHLRPGGVHALDRFRRQTMSSSSAAQILTRVFGYAEEMLLLRGDRRGNGGQGARGWANGTLSAMDYIGAGVASLVFARGQYPALWLARAVCDRRGAAFSWWRCLRRQLPETRRFAAQEGVQSGFQDRRRRLACCRDLVRQYPGRIATILIAAAAPLASPSRRPPFSRQKYLQGVYHYSPWQVTAGVHSRRPDRAGAGHPGGTAVRPAGPQAAGHRHRGAGRHRLLSFL